MNYDNISERIKALRKARKMTQYSLANLSYISALTIVRIENGQVTPNKSTLKCIADALGVSLDELVK